jgi:hypothetical protein
VSGAGEPNAALDGHGGSLERVLGQMGLSASVNAQEPIGQAPCALCGGLAPRSGSVVCGESRVGVTCAAPPPRLARPGERSPRSLLLE